MNFLSIDYLQSGNQKQRKAFEVLTKNAIMSNLSEFTPVLAGTIPINIDIENSDLDILCCWKDRLHFRNRLVELFAKEEQFALTETQIGGRTSLIANFSIGGFEMEIFGQDLPVTEQNGYLHMLKEYSILLAKGETFRNEIIALKRQGYKTEPAFALLLGLQGDPYEAYCSIRLSFAVP